MEKKKGIFTSMARAIANTSSLIRSNALKQYLNPGKDINSECGYPETISMTEYKAMYDRESIAARLVKIEPEECWTSTPAIYEQQDTDETEFEKEYNRLSNKFNFYYYLERIDVLSGIGQFGVMLIGISDGLDLNQPVKGIDLMTGEVTGTNKYELLYIFLIQLYLNP